MLQKRWKRPLAERQAIHDQLDPRSRESNMLAIGRILKEGRTAQGLDLGDIARRTCISSRYLKAMEEGQFSIIPKVFDKGYLKIYAKFLNIDPQTLLELYDKQQDEHPADLVNEQH